MSFHTRPSSSRGGALAGFSHFVVLTFGAARRVNVGGEAMLLASIASMVVPTFAAFTTTRVYRPAVGVRRSTGLALGIALRRLDLRSGA